MYTRKVMASIRDDWQVQERRRKKKKKLRSATREELNPGMEKSRGFAFGNDVKQETIEFGRLIIPESEKNRRQVSFMSENSFSDGELIH